MTEFIECPVCGDAQPLAASSCDCGNRLTPGSTPEVVAEPYSPRRHLTELALEVAAVLNVEPTREVLRDHFDEVLAHELDAGTRNRAALERFYTALDNAGFQPVDEFSKKVSA